MMMLCIVMSAQMMKTENQIFDQDCIEFMQDWDGRKPNLIIADPPYNIGVEYDLYKDNMDILDYNDWCTSWLYACEQFLHPEGSIFIIINTAMASWFQETIHHYFVSRNLLVWNYNFGQNQKNNFIPCHTNILYCTANKKKFTFNDDLIRFPSQRLLKYNDKRANPKGSIPSNVWEYPRVCGTFKEKRATPNQIPLALLRRIIFAASNPGDLVYDPFLGSGSTAITAKQLKRNYIGTDISEQYINDCRFFLGVGFDLIDFEHQQIIREDLLNECGVENECYLNKASLECFTLNLNNRLLNAGCIN